MQGNWKLVSVAGKAKTDKSSGNKLVFEGEVQREMFDGVLSVRHAEQFGKLALKQGSRLLFDGEIKLIRTDRRKDEGEAGSSKYQVVPTSRIDPKVFGLLYGAIDSHFEAEFIDTGAPNQSAGDGRPVHDPDEGASAGLSEDDNVTPGSVAADMKTAARRKVAKSA